MSRKNLFTIILLVFMTGCSSTIRYIPNTANTNTREAKETVKQVVQEQPHEVAPIKVEVTDQYFKMFATKTNSADGYTIPWNTVVYFNNVGKVKIKQKKRWSKQWYTILLMDNENNLKYTVYTAQYAKAKSFIDALYTLKKNEINENAMRYNL